MVPQGDNVFILFRAGVVVVDKQGSSSTKVQNNEPVHDIECGTKRGNFFLPSVKLQCQTIAGFIVTEFEDLDSELVRVVQSERDGPSFGTMALSIAIFLPSLNIRGKLSFSWVMKLE